MLFGWIGNRERENHYEVFVSARFHREHLRRVCFTEFPNKNLQIRTRKKPQFIFPGCQALVRSHQIFKEVFIWNERCQFITARKNLQRTHSREVHVVKFVTVKKELSLRLVRGQYRHVNHVQGHLKRRQVNIYMANTMYFKCSLSKL